MTTTACCSAASRWLDCTLRFLQGVVCCGILSEAVAGVAAEPVAIFHVGNGLTAVTHYAVVFREDPRGCIISGLRFWKAPYSVDRAFAQVVWDIVAEVTKIQPAT